MIMWKSIHMVLGIKPLRNSQNLFNDWYSWKYENFQSILLTGVATI
jgi:hypothetical protein